MLNFAFVIVTMFFGFLGYMAFHDATKKYRMLKRWRSSGALWDKGLIFIGVLCRMIACYAGSYIDVT